jgi:predicted NAD/FAD-binding protein
LDEVSDLAFVASFGRRWGFIQGRRIGRRRFFLLGEILRTRRKERKRERKIEEQVRYFSEKSFEWGGHI